MIRYLITIYCAISTLSPAGEAPAPNTGPTPAKPEPAAPPAKPVIEKLGETRYRIGKVTFDQKNREIRFPAKVNMTEGLLEFLLVQEKGKIHESLLLTDASPIHLNLALTLLRYTPSIELFSEIDQETGHPTGLYPDVPIEVRAGSRIFIDVEWNDGGKVRRNPINEWIQHLEDSAVMPPGPWVYSGSELHQGKYIPELTGDIAAIFTARAAMINYPGNDSGSDLVWYAFPKRVPPKDTEVTVIFTPFWKRPAAPKP